MSKQNASEPLFTVNHQLPYAQTNIFTNFILQKRLPNVGNLFGLSLDQPDFQHQTPFYYIIP